MHYSKVCVCARARMCVFMCMCVHVRVRACVYVCLSMYNTCIIHLPVHLTIL